MNYFVTAIGTNSGKTMISTALALALNADYWKPIQAGYPTDSEKVQQLSNNCIRVHKERFLLNTPASPHYAAEIENLSISLNDFQLPKTDNNLIIEGAGGCLVPINEANSVIDLTSVFNSEIILVSNNYLGSINHTLLTIEFLKSKNIAPKCIIFNGESNPSTEDVILKRSNIQCFFKVPKFNIVDKNTIYSLSEEFKLRWNELGW